MDRGRRLVPSSPSFQRFIVACRMLKTWPYAQYSSGSQSIGSPARARLPRPSSTTKSWRAGSRRIGGTPRPGRPSRSACRTLPRSRSVFQNRTSPGRPLVFHSHRLTLHKVGTPPRQGRVPSTARERRPLRRVRGARGACRRSQEDVWQGWAGVRHRPRQGWL